MRVLIDSTLINRPVLRKHSGSLSCCIPLLLNGNFNSVIQFHKAFPWRLSDTTRMWYLATFLQMSWREICWTVQKAGLEHICVNFESVLLNCKRRASINQSMRWRMENFHLMSCLMDTKVLKNLKLNLNLKYKW